MPSKSTRSNPAADPAYMKPSNTTSMETHDLGRRLSQAQLLQLASRNLNRSFEQGILAGVSSVDPTRLSSVISSSSIASSSFASSSKKSGQRRRVSSSALQPPALMSTSNADVIALREAVLQGEFDIISRSHVVRFEQDSAFKKDRRVTPEITALHNQQSRPPPGKGRSASRRSDSFHIYKATMIDTNVLSGPGSAQEATEGEEIQDT